MSKHPLGDKTAVSACGTAVTWQKLVVAEVTSADFPGESLEPHNTSLEIACMTDHTYLSGVSLQVSLLRATSVEIVVPELYKALLRTLRLACFELSKSNGCAASRNAPHGRELQADM